MPTTEEANEVTGEMLLDKLTEGIEEFSRRGVDKGLLERQCLITPSCGMGSLDVALSERILDLLVDTGAAFQKKIA